MKEIWKAIPGFGGRYTASNLGRVRSDWRSGRVMAPHTNKSGHLGLKLSWKNKKYHREVHGLVTETFFGPRPKGLEVRHLNGDPSDNRIENLEYGTRSQNYRDIKWHGGKSNTKLWPENVRDIKRRLVRGEGYRSIARHHGVHPTMIGHIKNGRVHTDVTVRSQTRPARGLTRRVA